MTNSVRACGIPKTFYSKETDVEQAEAAQRGKIPPDDFGGWSTSATRCGGSRAMVYFSSVECCCTRVPRSFKKTCESVKIQTLIL